MTSLLDEIVITDDNKVGFELILNVGQKHDQPVHAFVWGPVGSGKSTVQQARGREKDLLSTRRVVSAHGQEIVAALLSGINDEFLNEIGEVDALLVDGFDTLFQDEVGTSLAKLLLEQRNSSGLDTIVVSDVPLAEIPTDSLDGVLDDYVEVEVAPLQNEGLIELAKRVQDGIRKASDETPILDESAIEYLASDFAKDANDLRNAIRFLLTRTDLEPNQQIDEALATKLLAS